MHTLMQPNPIPPELLTWKDAEVDYCRSLLECSTREVPAQSTASYYRTQIISARKDGREDCAAYIRTLLKRWEHHPRYLALPDYYRDSFA